MWMLIIDKFHFWICDITDGVVVLFLLVYISNCFLIDWYFSSMGLNLEFSC